jgi:Flp pilus assembly protein TadG
MSVAATLQPRRDGSARRGSSVCDRGSASIEFAITAVAVMAIIFAAIQASTYFWARSIAQAAAQEGVTAQRAYNAVPGAGQARAASFIAGTGDGLTGTTVTVNADPEQVQVTVTGHCLSIIPGFCDAFPIAATVHGTVERVTAP